MSNTDPVLQVPNTKFDISKYWYFLSKYRYRFLLILYEREIKNPHTTPPFLSLLPHHWKYEDLSMLLFPKLFWTDSVLVQIHSEKTRCDVIFFKLNKVLKSNVKPGNSEIIIFKTVRTPTQKLMNQLLN